MAKGLDPECCVLCGVSFMEIKFKDTHQPVHLPDTPELAYLVNGTLFTTSSLEWLRSVVVLGRAKFVDPASSNGIYTVYYAGLPRLDRYRETNPHIEFSSSVSTNDLNKDSTEVPLGMQRVYRDCVPIHTACLGAVNDVLRKNGMPVIDDKGVPRTLYVDWILDHISKLSEILVETEADETSSMERFAQPRLPSYSLIKDIDRHAQMLATAALKTSQTIDLDSVQMTPYGQIPIVNSPDDPFRLPSRGYADERTEIIDLVKTQHAANSPSHNSPSGLLSLPTELITRITHFLPRAVDVLRFRRVCQRFYDCLHIGREFWRDAIRSEFWYLELRLFQMDPKYFAKRDSDWLKNVYRALRASDLPDGIGADLLWGEQSDPGLESLQWQNVKRVYDRAECVVRAMCRDIRSVTPQGQLLLKKGAP